jgi:hypothetical protein
MPTRGRRQVATAPSGIYILVLPPGHGTPTAMTDPDRRSILRFIGGIPLPWKESPQHLRTFKP